MIILFSVATKSINFVDMMTAAMLDLYQHGGVRLCKVCVCESSVKLCGKHYMCFVIILAFKLIVCALMQCYYYNGFGFTPALSCRRRACCLYMAPNIRPWLGKEIIKMHFPLVYLANIVTVASHLRSASIGRVQQ